LAENTSLINNKLLMQRKKIEKEKKPVILKINLAFNVWDIFGASNTSINVDHKANTGMSKYASN